MTTLNEHIQKVPFSLEKIILGMPEQSYVFSKEGRLLIWNKNSEILTGFSSEELTGKFVTELIYAPDKERVVGKMMELIAEGEDDERIIEYRIETKTGQIIPVLAMRGLVFIDGEKYIVGILFDVSKIKKGSDIAKSKLAELGRLKKDLHSYYRDIEKISQTVIELREEVYLNTKNFNDKLISNLPGIFYVYEKVGDQFYLKKWNNKYITDLGYSNSELFNQQPHYFFTEKEMIKAAGAISQIFVTGSTQIEILTNHKCGTQIPYFYEGFLFEDGDRFFFIGIGIDISKRYALEKNKIKQEAQERKSTELIQTKERELVASALNISRTSNIINTTLKRIDQLISKNRGTAICDELTQIKKELLHKNKETDNWQVFKLRFTEVHKDFFTQLIKKHPTLTKSELQFCAYLRISLSSSQISSVLNVTNEAIKKTRYRTRKKLGLSPKESLEEYILKF